MIIDDQTPLRIASTAFEHNLFVKYIESALSEHWIGREHNALVIEIATIYGNETVYPSSEGWYKGVIEVVSASELNSEAADEEFMALRQYSDLEFGLADASGFPVPVYRSPGGYIGGIRFTYVNWSNFSLLST